MSDGPIGRQRPNLGGAGAVDGGFLQAAVHSATHTVPRGSLRERLVPWSLAVIMTLGIAVAGVGFAAALYPLMWSSLGVVAALAVFAAVTHAWRASTRYKRPLDAPVDQPRRRR